MKRKIKYSSWIVPLTLVMVLLVGLFSPIGNAMQQKKKIRKQIPLAQQLDMLAAKGLVMARGAVVSLPGHSVSFDAGEQENVDRVLDVVRSSGPAPPEASSLPAGRDLLEAMVKQGLLPSYQAGQGQRGSRHLFALSGVLALRDSPKHQKHHLIPIHIFYLDALLARFNNLIISGSLA